MEKYKDLEYEIVKYKKIQRFFGKLPKDCSFYFSRTTRGTVIDLSNVDTSEVTNMRGMFAGCYVKYIDVSNFDTSNVKDMSYMFDGCMTLLKLDISNFNISKASYKDIFKRCYNLEELYLPTNFCVEDDLFSECWKRKDGILKIYKRDVAI